MGLEVEGWGLGKCRMPNAEWEGGGGEAVAGKFSVGQVAMHLRWWHQEKVNVTVTGLPWLSSPEAVTVPVRTPPVQVRVPVPER